MKNIWKRAGVLLLAVLCSVTMLTAQTDPVLAVTWSDVNDLKADAGALQSQRKELQNKLNALSKDKSKAMDRKVLLDQQIANTSAQIRNAESQIQNYTSLIAQTEVELQEAEEKEAIQHELFCGRVRSMEERGEISYWSVLFKANSFADLLGRLDAINEIMDADQKVIDDLKKLQEEIAAKKVQLEESKADAEVLKADLVKKRSELDTQRVEANKVIAEISEDAAEMSAAIKATDAERKAIQNEIQRLSKELAEKEAAANGGKPAPQPTKGGYIWPVNSHYITSPYGPRPSPGGVGSRYHKGIDIGRVGYTSEVRAAKAGTVIVSKYSNSYGNYVVVSHGSGNTTLYAHMSSRKVTEGQKVSQGAVLGITGSTGRSTGPHLHFEISENGNRVNPLNYLTNYTRGNW